MNGLMMMKYLDIPLPLELIQVVTEQIIMFSFLGYNNSAECIDLNRVQQFTLNVAQDNQNYKLGRYAFC